MNLLFCPYKYYIWADLGDGVIEIRNYTKKGQAQFSIMGLVIISVSRGYRTLPLIKIIEYCRNNKPPFFIYISFPYNSELKEKPNLKILTLFFIKMRKLFLRQYDK